MYKNYIPNRIKQSSQCCIYCGKTYKNRINLDKHISLCELIYKTRTTKTKFIIEDEEDEIPSQKKLYKAILILTKKYSKLEEKVEEINKFVVKKKKRINIIEWLNTNITPDIVFEQLIDKIIVTEQDIEYLFKNTVYDTFNQIFHKTLYLLKNSEKTTPLFGFIQKSNILYIYDKTINSQEQEPTIKWHELSRDKLIAFLYNVHNKISRKLYNWKQKMSNEIKRNDNMAIQYDKTILKLMSTDFKHETTFLKMRAAIYQNMKTDMKGLIEYEFEF